MQKLEYDGVIRKVAPGVPLRERYYRIKSGETPLDHDGAPKRGIQQNKISTGPIDEGLRRQPARLKCGVAPGRRNAGMALFGGSGVRILTDDSRRYDRSIRGDFLRRICTAALQSIGPVQGLCQNPSPMLRWDCGPRIETPMPMLRSLQRSSTRTGPLR